MFILYIEDEDCELLIVIKGLNVYACDVSILYIIIRFYDDKIKFRTNIV